MLEKLSSAAKALTVLLSSIITVVFMVVFIMFGIVVAGAIALVLIDVANTLAGISFQ